MPKDIDQELDAILAHHQARVSQVRHEAADKVAAERNFNIAAIACVENVIMPALHEMARALNQRGVAARVPADGGDARIDIPVSRHARLGHGHGGHPYLRAKLDRQAQRIHFERNTADSRGGSAVGDYTIAEVNAELVKTMVMELVRVLYAPI